MFKNKSIILSGNNNQFNDYFLANYFKKAGNISVVESYLSGEYVGGDILFHYVSNELEKVHDFFQKDEDDLKTKMTIKESIKNHIKKVVFLSDGSTPVQNDKMIKNLMLKASLNSSKTSFLYIMIKDCKNMQEMIDFATLALKNGKNGDIFVKKVQQRMTFADRLKSLVKSETKRREDQDSFFSSSEMARVVDYGEFLRVPMESRVLEEA